MAGCQVSPKALHSEVKRAIHFQKKKDTDGRIPARFVKGVKSRAQLRQDILKYEAFKDAAEVILTNCTRHVCARTPSKHGLTLGSVLTRWTKFLHRAKPKRTSVSQWRAASGTTSTLITGRDCARLSAQ